MKKIIFVILLVASVLCADTKVKVGTLSYSLSKNTNPINLAPAAKVRTSGSESWVQVRFPGYESFYTVDRGFYPGWSSSCMPSMDIATATGPTGYTYVFELGVTDSTDFFDYGRGTEYRLKHILNPSGVVEDKYIYDEDGFVDRIYDGNDLGGVYLHFDYDSSKSEITSITAVDPSVSSLSFNHSRSYLLNYDLSGALVGITNGASGCGCSGGSSNWLTDVYDTNGKLAAQKNSQNQTIYTYSHSFTGSLAEKKNGSGDTIFKAATIPLEIGRKGVTYNYINANFYRYSESIYNSSGTMTEKRVYKELRDNRDDPNTFDTTYSSTHYLYSGNSEIVIPDGAPTDGSGERVYNYYDDRYRLRSVYEYSATDSLPLCYRNTESSNYTGEGFVSSEYDIRGGCTSYEYVANTSLIAKKVMPFDGYSHATYYLYNYDSQNRLIKEALKIDDAEGSDYNDTTLQSKHYEYDIYGNVCKEYLNGGSNRSDPNSIVTEYVYNAFGDLVWQISPSGVVSGRVYNNSGEHTDDFILAGGKDAFDTITDPLDCDMSEMLVLSQTKYQYHGVNGKQEYISMAISNDAFLYDNPSGWSRTKYVYDLYGRRTSEIQDFGGANLTTTYAYNLQDEVISTTNSAGKTTQTIRDGQGLTIQTIETDGQQSITTDYIYDNRGRLLETKVNNTAVKSYEYGLFDRVAKIYEGASNSDYYVEYLYDGITDDVETEIVWDNDGANDVAVSKVFKKYDVLGRVIFQRDFQNPEDDYNAVKDRLTYYRYDGYGNLVLTAYKGVGNYYGLYSDMGYNYDYLIKGDSFATIEDYYAGDIAEVRKFNNNGELLAEFKGYSLELTDVDIVDLVDIVADDIDLIEAFIAATGADVSLTKYSYAHGQIASQSVYTGVIDGGELVYRDMASYEYDDAGRRFVQTAANGSYSVTYYNSMSQEIETAVYDAQDAIMSRTQNIYDDLGRPVWQAAFKDPAQTEIDITADKIMGYAYNSAGQLEKQGLATGYTTFAVINWEVVFYPIFDYSEFAYDWLGRKTSTTDSSGNQEIVTYNDVWGKPASTQIVRASSVEGVNDLTTTTSYTYDTSGRLVEITEQGRTNPIEYEYLGNHVVQEVLADGTVNQYGYDGFGNQTLALMDDGGVNQYTYKGYDRLDRQVSISGFTEGNTLGNKLETLYEYDYKNNIISITYPDSTGIEYVYDYLGKVIERRDRQENITEYTYDAGGFLFQKNNIFELWDIDENDPNIVTLVRDSKPWQLYTHDAIGRLTNVCLLEIDGQQQFQIAVHSREYDGLGNIVSTSDGHIGGTDTEVLYGYYPNGQIASMTYPDGRVVSYQTYGENQVRQVRADGKLIAEYDYLGEKVLSRRLSQAGVGINNSFDTRGRITTEVFYDIATSTTLTSNGYSYKTNTDLISSKTTGGTPQTYGYDDLQRLTSYNAATYSLNDVSEQISPPAAQFAYYTDCENRITDVNDLQGSQIADYSYDALGRRNKKVVYDGENSSTIYYVYDIMGNVITEYEQSTGAVSWAKDYIYGGRGELVSLHLPRTAAMNAAFDNLMSFATAWLCYPSCTTQQLVWDTNSDDQINLYDYVDNAHNTNYFDGAFSSNIYYCLADKNNSVVGLVDANMDIEYITYNAWGVPSYSGDIQGLSVLWNGYYFDNETENYYLRNRYYSPTQRKFLTDDPHGIIPDGNWNNTFAIMNQYDDGVGLMVYAGFNPVNNRDDWGLECESCGPDVTTALWKLNQKIDRDWNNMGYAQKYWRCISMSNPVSGWDIQQFAPGSQTPSTNTCPSKNCKGTVTVGGKCYNASEVNYWLYGKLTNKCGQFNWDALGSIYGWKIGTYHHLPSKATVGWYKAGRGSDLFNVPGDKTEKCNPSRTKWKGDFKYKFGTFVDYR